MFIIKVHKSVIVTYLGVIFASIAMYFAFTKMAFSEISYLRYSLIFLVLSGICDMFDGKVARMCKRTEEEKEFGIQIDSLADTVNFVVLPVVIMLSLGMNTILDVVAYMLLILCGVSRLGYFNVHASMDNPVKFYSGLPVTSTAIIYPLLGLLHGNISENLFQNIYLVATFLIAFLFVAKIKVPKLKGLAYVIVPILAAILVVLLLVIR
ncbi:MAG: phosphatidylcholine/phosphatidylserine synthase [Firmicutes bacterium]|nr:phosphatidylcholine/phosphatidylserine synthase [Bacillota bacterium]